MNNVGFNNFVQENPEWKTTYGVYKRDDDNYQRIPINYSEEITNKENEVVGTFHHKYHATIDVRSGEIYLDCRKRKLFVKHLTLAIVRPIHTIIKTLWHASIIGPLAYETFKLFSKPTEDELSLTKEESALSETEKTKLLEEKKAKLWKEKRYHS